MQISDERELGRAKNAVLELFEDRLYIPKIYLDATWEGQQVDVLAIDRDGIGDVHLVILLNSASFISPEHLKTTLEPAIERIFHLSAQYKYIALVQTAASGSIQIPEIPRETLDRALAPDGLGRIGFLSVTVPYGDESKATYLLKPERFRARVAEMADDYVRQHIADWELRDSPVA